MKDITITKRDHVLIAVLVTRAYSRLPSQAKTLEKALHLPYADKETSAYSPWPLTGNPRRRQLCLDRIGGVLPKHRDAFKRSRNCLRRSTR